MKRYVPEGGFIPTFYAIAYRDWSMDASVAYPIPLHLVVRVYRDFVAHAREWWRPSYRDELEQAAHRRGYHMGHADGFRIGLKRGAEDFRDQLLAGFDDRYGTHPDLKEI